MSINYGIPWLIAFLKWLKKRPPSHCVRSQNSIEELFLISGDYTHCFRVALVCGTAIVHSARLYYHDSPIWIQWVRSHGYYYRCYCFLLHLTWLWSSTECEKLKKNCLPQIFQNSPIYVGGCYYFFYSCILRQMISFGGIIIEKN